MTLNFGPLVEDIGTCWTFVCLDIEQVLGRVLALLVIDVIDFSLNFLMAEIALIDHSFCVVVSFVFVKSFVLMGNFNVAYDAVGSRGDVSHKLTFAIFKKAASRALKGLKLELVFA